jgi:50S ribosomal subunit-associated GTPase HflX
VASGQSWFNSTLAMAMPPSALAEFEAAGWQRRGACRLPSSSGRRTRPDPALFAGKGKVAEIGDAVRLHER